MRPYPSSTLTFTILVLAMSPGLGWSQTPDDAAPAAQASFQTAPALKANPLVRDEKVRASAAPTTPVEAPAAAPLGAPQAFSAEELATVPGNLHPWPLRQTADDTPTALLLEVPSVASTRLLLAGPAMEAAMRARSEFARYATGLVGQAALQRGKQSEQFESWVKQVADFSKSLPADPWAEHVFWTEARGYATKYLEAIRSQARGQTLNVIADVRPSIEKIAGVYQVMPTYEAQTAWYELLVYMRDALQAYERQTRTADSGLIARIEAYLASTPIAPRPAGAAGTRGRAVPQTASARPQLPGATFAPQGESGSSADAVAQRAARVPAPAAPPEQETAAPRSTGSNLLMIGAAVIAVLSIFIKRKKNTSTRGSVPAKKQ